MTDQQIPFPSSLASFTADPALPVIRRLGPRLNHLYQWVLRAGPFDDIWDLCCDHGRLGLHLHQALRNGSAEPGSRIHLVDRVPKIIDVLKEKYAPLMDSRLSVSCMDAGDVALTEHSRQVVLIAGVGGGTVATIMAQILARTEASGMPDSGYGIEFMLSPNLNTFELRCYLRRSGFELIAEEFVEEKGQAHEHLYVRYGGPQPPAERVTVVGERLWRPFTKAKETYLRKQLKHYENCAGLGGVIEAKAAIEAYRELLTTAYQTQTNRSS